MDESQFRYRASILHLPRQMRRDVVRNRLYIYLGPDFNAQQCSDLIRLHNKGLRPAVAPLPPQPPAPHITIPPGHSGPVYIILGQHGAQKETQQEENTSGPNWVLPLAIILLIIGIVAVLIAINPSLIPPAIMAAFGG